MEPEKASWGEGVGVGGLLLLPLNFLRIPINWVMQKQFLAYFNPKSTTSSSHKCLLLKGSI